MVCQVGPVLSQQMSHAEMIEHLAQSICIDVAGEPTDALPVDEGCSLFRPQRANDIAIYRKHDWPNLRKSLFDLSDIVG